MSARPTRIYLFTDRYPYGRGETFVEGELRTRTGGTEKITVFPARKAQTIRRMPEGIALNTSLAEAPRWRKAAAAFRALFSPYLWSLPFRSRRPNTLRGWRNAAGGLYRAYLTFLTLKSSEELFSRADVFYSYWLDNTATGIALAKGRLKTLRDKPLVCRAHGYDVFEQTRGIFFPARPQALERIDRVFPVSFAGESYLKACYPRVASRIVCRHLGVDNQAVPPREAPQKVLRIVSCANVIALKRIDLTGEFLKRYARLHPETQIRWTHFGTGVLLEHVKTLAEEDAPENFHAVFEGAVENREILRRYAAGEFDVFVSLSRSEGMPVSAIEAMSCGIVPLCTDAGGTRDAVDASCGALLPVDLTAEAFAEALDTIREHYGTLSAAALEKQRRDFCARNNFEAFYRTLDSLAGEKATLSRKG